MKFLSVFTRIDEILGDILETDSLGHDDPVPPSQDSAVVLEELALVRYARRTGSQEVQVTGGVACFTLAQEMFDADGRSIGTGRIHVVGRRAFGGTVHVEAAPRLDLPGTASADDIRYFEGMVRDLLAVLPTLCCRPMRDARAMGRRCAAASTPRARRLARPRRLS